MAAKTPAQIAALDTYSAAEMVKLIDWAIATVTSDPNAQATIGGRSWTLADLDKLQRMRVYYAKIAANDTDEAASDDGICPAGIFQDEHVDYSERGAVWPLGRRVG